MPEGQKIILCLSGGGLRATLFHLGVIKTLRDENLLRPGEISDIVSVSGGSILAAHMITNWNKYSSYDNSAFESMCSELRSFAASDIRGRVLRRYLLTTPFRLIAWPVWGRETADYPSLSHHLELQYQKLVGKRTFRTIYSGNNAHPPNIHFIGTELKSGKMCTISNCGYQMGNISLPAHDIPIALALAASSAFPPLFPPAIVRKEMLGVKDDEMLYSPHKLSDGGVFDNLGLDRAMQIIESQPEASFRVICSNASPSLDLNTHASFSDIVSRNVRAVDILMERIARRSVESTDGKRNVTYVSIDHSLDNDVVPGTVQQGTRRIRTDLDRFNPTEQAALIEHGALISQKAFGIRIPNQSARWTDSEVRRVRSKLETSSNRKLSIFNFRDWATFALLLAIAAPIALAGTIVKRQLSPIVEESEVKGRQIAKLIVENNKSNIKINKLEVAMRALEARLTALPPATRKCQIPENGVERYEVDTIENQPSGWRGGGYDPVKYCNEYITTLQSKHRDGTYQILNSYEEKRDECPPFNCVKYQYYCQIRVQAQPVFKLAENPLCPAN